MENLPRELVCRCDMSRTQRLLVHTTTGKHRGFPATARSAGGETPTNRLQRTLSDQSDSSSTRRRPPRPAGAAHQSPRVPRRARKGHAISLVQKRWFSLNHKLATVQKKTEYNRLPTIRRSQFANSTLMKTRTQSILVHANVFDKHHQSTYPQRNEIGLFFSSS